MGSSHGSLGTDPQKNVSTYSDGGTVIISLHASRDPKTDRYSGRVSVSGTSPSTTDLINTRFPVSFSDEPNLVSSLAVVASVIQWVIGAGLGWFSSKDISISTTSVAGLRDGEVLIIWTVKHYLQHCYHH